MTESKIDAEMIALEQEISKLQASINKSQTFARDSSLPESRRTTIAEQDYMGQGARPKSDRTTAQPNTSIRPDNLTELLRTADEEPDRFSFTSTPYHANTSGHNETNITTRRPENIAQADKRKVDIVKTDKFDEGTSWLDFKSHFEVCAELN